MSRLVNAITHTVVYLDLAFVMMLFAVGLYKRINAKEPAAKIGEEKDVSGEFMQDVNSEAGMGKIFTK